MLKHPTTDLMATLGLNGMLQALEEQLAAPEPYREMEFLERLAYLIDREQIHRHNSILTRRLRTARLRQNACIEDIDFRQSRGLDKSLVAELTSGQWVRGHQNLLITGPTGVGKSYLGCAFAHRSCVLGFSAQYIRAPILFNELSIVKETGRYKQTLQKLAKIQVLVIDDWGLHKLNDEAATDFLEIAEDRHDRRSLIMTSQFKVDDWHSLFENPTLADAVLDRIVHNAHRIELKGESIRKTGRLKNEVEKPMKE
jgi:DNA replication protein DnaC